MVSCSKQQERFKCTACNTVYSKKYMTQHHKTLKHLENVCEMEMDPGSYLTLGPETEEEENYNLKIIIFCCRKTFKK